MTLKAGEKQLVIYQDKPFTPCTQYHPDNLIRVKDITIDVSRPSHREKPPMITTSDVS